MVKFTTRINGLEEQGGVECREDGLAAHLRAPRHIQLGDVREVLWDSREELVSHGLPPNHNGLYPREGVWDSVLDVFELELTVQHVDVNETADSLHDLFQRQEVQFGPCNIQPLQHGEVLEILEHSVAIETNYLTNNIQI